MSGRFEVHRMRQRLDGVFGRAPGAASDPQMQADYAKYLCVLISGFLERAIVALLIARAEEKATPDLASFVEATLEGWRNPKAEKILTLLGSFDTRWRSELEAFLASEKKEAIDSIVALRNQIAHGENVGTTLSQIKYYWIQIVKVVDRIADLVVPAAGRPPN